MLTALKRFVKFEVGPKIGRFWSRAPGYSYAMAYDKDGVIAALRPDGRPERRVRLRSGSDSEVFGSIFAGGEYSIARMARGADVRQQYERIVAAGQRPLIIDAGANIGLASIYFRDSYPEAAIVSIEPEPGNFRELQRNMGDDPLAMPLNAALAGSDGELDVLDPGEGNWGFRTGIAGAGASLAKVPAHSPARLLALAAERWAVEPLIFKIDIEGFESALFEGDASWIDAFPLVIIELHDWMLPKQGSSRSFLKAISGRDRDFVHAGENVFSFRN